MLTVKQEDYEALAVKSKPWQVLAVIAFTQMIQCYALSIMWLDTGLFDASFNFYSSDKLLYCVLRYFLLAFSWVLFLHELNEALG